MNFKKLFYNSCLLLTLSTVAFAQDEKVAPAADNSNNPNAPEITFESEVHDFGTIPYASAATFDFKFTNTGKEPLIISGARGSCGCTVPKWSKEPILKGQTGNINVSYDTKRVGPFTKTVTVNSNAKTPVKVITIKGSVLSQEETESQTPVKKNTSFTPLEKTN